MAVPLEALQVVCLSFLSAALYEAVMWLLFYRSSSYGRQMEQLERLGKRLDAAQEELAEDPNNASKKKAWQRLQKDLGRFSLSMQSTKIKVALLTGASMLAGMWLVNRRFKGVAVAKFPFVPPSLFTNLTHLGLPGTDMTDVSAAFFFATTGPLFRSNLQKLLGSGPSRTATKYLNSPAVPMDKKAA